MRLQREGRLRQKEGLRKRGWIATQNVETSQYLTLSAHKHITDDRLSSLFVTDCVKCVSEAILLPKIIFF